MFFLAQEGGLGRGVHFDDFANASLWVILIISLVALAFAAYLRREVLAASEGTEQMKSIARANIRCMSVRSPRADPSSSAGRMIHPPVRCAERRGSCRTARTSS